MRKTVEVILPYVTDKGKDKEYEFNIGFVSNRIVRDYTELQKNIKTISESWTKIQVKKLDIEEIEKLSDGNYTKQDTKKLEKLLSEIEKESEKMQDINSDTFFQKRFDLICSILKMNKYTGKKEYLTYKFWDENVDPGDIIQFLTSCVLKDASEKK